MKELTQMKARDLQEELKRGAGMKDLCLRYNATPEDVERSIRRLYNQSETKANDILGELAKNDKRAGKKRKAQPQAEENHEAAENITAEEEPTTTETPETTPTETIPNLDEMQSQAAALSNEVIELELQHESLRTQRAGLKNALGELSTRLTKLRKQIVSIGDEYREKAGEFNRIGEEMVAISEAKSLKVGRLDELNARIEQLRVIELFVYDDGSIVAENRPDIVLDENGYQDIYYGLLHTDKDYLDLKKSQLMVLAKTICIVDNLGRDANLSLAFDDEEIELAYELFREAA